MSVRKVVWGVLLGCLTGMGVASADGVVDALRAELGVQLRLAGQRIERIEAHQSEVREAWNRVQRLAADLTHAQRQGETLESLELRDADLRRAEFELVQRILESERYRAALRETWEKVEALQAEIQARQGEARAEDPLTGRWRVAVEPGGLEGYFDLELNGTLVEGTYELSGGWTGSLKGTLVERKVRLERIDSQLGFAAVFYGWLFPQEEPPRLQGTWEGTQLGAGLPSSGTWVAQRADASERSAQ